MVHKSEYVPDWQTAFAMANTIWENADDAVGITTTVFASGINQVSVACKRRIVFQITEVDERKKKPVQKSIFE
jgi:hypothetical protein